MVTIINSPDQECTDLINYITTQEFIPKLPITITFKPRRANNKKLCGFYIHDELSVVIYDNKYRGLFLTTISHELRHVEQFHYNLSAGKTGKWAEKDADTVGLKYYKNFMELNKKGEIK